MANVETATIIIVI